MNMGRLGLVLVFFVLLGGCEPVPLQYPPGPAPGPSVPGAPPPSQPSTLPQPGTQTQPQATGAQQGQYVIDRAMEGVAMGGSVAGPYGAGAGLIIGGLFGLLTADSYYEQLNAQIQGEQAKDKELEAQLERELERQRELEAQLEKRGGPSEPQPRERRPVAGWGLGDEPEKVQPAAEKEKIGSLASLGKSKTFPPTRTSPFKNVEIRDVNQDGAPDLWITYDPLKPGEVIRQEEDTNWDGRVDTWSYFNNAKLVRREVDTDGDGRGDRVFFYKDESLAREERGERGDGRPGYRAVYEGGRLAKVEKDLNQDGKIDLWVTYDTGQPEEVVVREERDLNGDGAVDLWSYYEGGRLVRRDVSTVGLDYLSKQGKPLPEVPSETLPKG